MASLFQLPEYEQATVQWIWTAINELMRVKDPVLQQIRQEVVEGIPPNRLTLASGEVMDMPPLKIEAQFLLPTPPLIQGDFAPVYEALETAADQGLASMMPQFFKNIADICEAAGQSIKTAGLTYDSILEGLEGIQIDFKDDGSPRLPTLTMHPDTAAKLVALGSPTEEQNRRYQELIEKKRRDFLARRRTRRLP